MRNFNTLSRPSAYDVAKMLADRDDALHPYHPIEIPEMEYPHPTLKDTSLHAFFANIINIATP